MPHPDRPARAMLVLIAMLVVTGSEAGDAAAQRSIEELAARLESADPRMRREAVRELDADGSTEAVQVLIRAAGDADRGVRRAVLEALVSVRRPETVPGFILFLGDEERDHRRMAIRGLVEVHGREPPPGASARAVTWLLRREEEEFVLDPLRPVQAVTVEAIVGRLDDEDDAIRELAAEALGALREEAAVTGLVEAATTEENRNVQRESVRALGTIGSDSAGEALLGMLEAEESRREVVEALGDMAHRPAGSALIGIYDADPESDLGRSALAALARMGHAGARGTFYHELTSRDARRRTHAVEGLGRLDDRSLTDGMIRDFLREDDERVQLAYCFALSRLGETPFVDRVVLSLGSGRLASAARSYALELGTPFLAEFVRYLDDPDRDVRLELIVLLERLGDAAAIPALTRLGGDPDVELATRARVAVRRLSG